MFVTSAESAFAASSNETRVRVDDSAKKGMTVVDERVHRSAVRAAGEEDIVDEHDDAAVDGERDLRLAYHRRVADSRQVVAVERDIDRSQRDQGAFVGADGGLDAGRERVA